MTVGTWTACNYRLTQLFNIPLPVTTTLEYINLVLGALSVAMYFKDNVYELKDTFMINLYKIFVGCLSVFIVVSLIFLRLLRSKLNIPKFSLLDDNSSITFSQ